MDNSQQRDAFEPTVGEHLRLGKIVQSIDKNENLLELREVAKELARQTFLVYPAVVRWLSREAAKNLAQGVSQNAQSWEKVAEKISEELLENRK